MKTSEKKSQSEELDITEFKPSFLRNDKLPIGVIAMGLRHGMWRFRNLPPEIQVKVRQYLKNADSQSKPPLAVPE